MKQLNGREKQNSETMKESKNYLINDFLSFFREL